MLRNKNISKHFDSLGTTIVDNKAISVLTNHTTTHDGLGLKTW